MSATQTKGLGKGLSVLMSEEYSDSSESNNTPQSTRLVDLDSIHSGSFQPRRYFDENYLNELADSIKRNGIMQPIIVRPKEDATYEIIAGERRWRAARIAGLDEVPVIIRDLDDQQALEIALIENIQRQDLKPLEEAAGYQRLIDEFSYTQEELANAVGKSRSHVANLLRLLALPEKIKTFLDEDKISMGHARALLNANEPEKLVDEVINRGLNVRQTENLCKNGSLSENGYPTNKSSSGSASAPRAKDPDILALEETLSENLGMKVSINDRGSQGEIIISYDSLNKLDTILKRLGGAS